MNKTDKDLLKEDVCSDMNEIIMDLNSVEKALHNKSISPSITNLMDFGNVLGRLVVEMTNLLEASSSRHSGLTGEIRNIRVAAIKEVNSALTSVIAEFRTTLENVKSGMCTTHDGGEPITDSTDTKEV